MLAGDISPEPFPLPAQDPLAPDPFAPDPTVWPPAPDWLAPTVFTVLGVAVLAVVVLLVLWRRSIVMERRRRAEEQAQEWVDLSKLDRKGNWREDDEV